MKSILLSVQPKWVEKIVSREKDIEVRTKMPNCDLPIDVYVYVTKEKNKEQQLFKVGGCFQEFTNFETMRKDGVDEYYENELKKVNGFVVAKFTLNKIEELDINLVAHWYATPEMIKSTCLSQVEIEQYQKNVFKSLYAWHIDNLVIFDKVKELKEFYKLCKYSNSYDLCSDCCGYAENSQCKNGLIPITKAPQSFCYVECEE